MPRKSRKIMFEAVSSDRDILMSFTQNEESNTDEHIV